MVIKGRYEDYVVKWVEWGWSYAKPAVYVRRPFLIFFTKLKRVWTGESKLLVNAGKLYPSDMREWFQSAVDEYEDYTDAWDKHQEQNADQPEQT